MLSERDYMRSQNRRPQPFHLNCIFLLIGINVGVFLLLPSTSPLLYDLVLSAKGIQQFKIWQFVTYLFLHGSPLHLFFNMWGLYLFGTAILPALGTVRFLTLYFLSGISGAALWLGFNWNSPSLVVGASGAVMGIMMAAAMLYPNMRIMLLIPPIPMKLRTFVIIYAAIEVVSEISNLQGGIAHFAHLGGFIGAYFYIRALYADRDWKDLSGWRFLKRKTAVFSSKSSPDWDASADDLYHAHDPTWLKEEVDRLLDKISAQGMKSLTAKEMATLKRASEELKNK